LKRNLRDAAALTARCFEHFALSAVAAAAVSAAAVASGCFTRCAAIRATARFVRKPFAREEFLFANREGERSSAIDAIEIFIFVHERVS
jgi:hypothetical protein